MYPQSQIEGQAMLLAQTTINEYRRVLRLVAEAPEPFLANIKTKGRARVVKAALRWSATQADTDIASTSQADRNFGDVLVKLGGANGVLALASKIDVEPLQRRVGRVRKLQGLRPDWAERLVAATQQETPLEHAAVIALHQTGCRLSELTQIALRVHSGHLAIAIPGKKLKAQAGQKLRGLTLPLESRVTTLAALCPKDGTFVQPFRDLSMRRVERVIEKASQATLGDPRRVNSSCLRNNVASLCKAAGWPPGRIAELLGHQSEGTQKYYGRATMGTTRTGWVQPINVSATHPTRQVADKPFLVRLADETSPSRHDLSQVPAGSAT